MANSGERFSVDLFWQRFREVFPTDELAMEELINRCIAAKDPCCDNPRFEKEPGARFADCLNCKKQVYFTAGTFLEDIRHGTAWLAAILSFEHGVIMSACRFAREARCAYSTAWEIFQRLRLLIECHMDDSSGGLGSGYFRPIIRRRSRETPARMHPFAEVLELQELEQQKLQEEGARMDSSEQSNEPTGGSLDAILSKLGPDHRAVYDSLSDDLLHCDLIIQRTGLPAGLVVSILVELEIAGLIITVGSRYKRASIEEGKNSVGFAPAPARAPAPSRRAGSDSTSIMQGRSPAFCEPPNQRTNSQGFGSFEDILKLIQSTFHGVSRKYLTLYSAQFWCAANSVRWGVGTLFRECVYAEKISRDDILTYVSDFVIKLPYLGEPA